jgi:phage-related holin
MVTNKKQVTIFIWKCMLYMLFEEVDYEILEMLKALVIDYITTAINEQDPDLLQVEVKDLNV